MAANVDRVWQAMVTLVMDSRGDWRKRVSEATGLPFTQMRALKRLSSGPLTLSELASALDADAPAATVAVNGLEERGLVERKTRRDDRRVKTVSLTAEGKRVLRQAKTLVDRAPATFRSLSDSDVAVLRQILARVGAK
ncbi:MAG: MarR family transcriptional regulator [Polyangiaceae bacterium]|jgi:DNA-binding MarR family transcriptional regulator